MVAPDADEAKLQSYVTAQIPMPAKLKNQNMVIEINGGDKQEFKTYYSNTLKVSLLESYGELKVSHSETNAALPRTYVKVYGQH